MKSLAGKNIVITGGAAGIGRLMALGFARETSNIAVLDICEDNLRSVEQELRDAGVIARGYLCDVSSREQVEQVARSVREDFSHVDILVNNAGIAPGAWIAESEYDTLRKTIEVNLIGLMWMTRQFLPHMIERNSGHIVNIASAMGFQAVPRMADYVASKHGVIGYSDTLRIEMKRQRLSGITVTVVCPGGIDTGMFSGYRPPMLMKLLQPEAVADKVVWAVKKKKSYVKMPAIVILIPALKLFPVTFTDRLVEKLGLFSAMDHLDR